MPVNTLQFCFLLGFVISLVCGVHTVFSALSAVAFELVIFAVVVPSVLVKPCC